MAATTATLCYGMIDRSPTPAPFSESCPSAFACDACHTEVLKTYSTDRPVGGAVISPIRDHVILGGGQDAQSVTTTKGSAGRFESRIFHMIYEEEMGRVKGEKKLDTLEMPTCICLSVAGSKRSRPLLVWWLADWLTVGMSLCVCRPLRPHHSRGRQPRWARLRHRCHHTPQTYDRTMMLAWASSHSPPTITIWSCVFVSDMGSPLLLLLPTSC